MKYGYARVSTKHQSLDVQTDKLKEQGCEIIYQEKFTGTKCDRPELNKLIEKIKAGDTLVVCKLDRLARNVKEGIELVELLFKKNVKVDVLNLGLLENTTIGRFYLQLLLAVAEMERNMIVERVVEGLENARKRDDFTCGRPKKFSREHIDFALNLKKDYTFKEIARKTGISIATLKRASRAQKIKELKKENII
jgi:DNA invertase Pin-like site-specific DNA recombinase